ncbi:uncharacterized protein Z518_04220 [Rhinocladiella mackenziei CBS 650.93]|uniref:Gfd2/YDR514C-like C-terminal domain-containing protein n=1 Tax=Rhinocladiella mackenziei CBS 650.93 TaxID=1442369 RepID=A0A0D2JAV8_9EURO|nr:uncharacterized protein Z518_04220 [Rhinocladiella mackenziei CBS 650.93]KIX06245.1 hypothetical protein Z518_04220 [Rhinocladiella mackenziei CBS 650.93]
METTPRDRLGQLFANQPRPSLPIPGQPHFSEMELDQKKAMDQNPRRLTSIAQYPRQVKSRPQPPRNVDCLTSSDDDDDDYVSAFKQKPSMKIPAKQEQGPLEYVANGKKSSKYETNDNMLQSRVSESDDHLPTSNTKGHPVTGRFCLFTLAAKFPYKYMNDSHDRVSRHFFAANKFYDRTWDLYVAYSFANVLPVSGDLYTNIRRSYYLEPPYTLGGKPILLIPYAQAEQLIHEIGQTFQIAVSVPKFPFTLTFYDDGTPQPTFLGTSRSRSEVGDLQASIPPTPMDHGECPPDAVPDVQQKFDDFKEKCRTVLAANRRKGAVAKKKKEDDRLLSIQDWYKQLRRAQRYLGLRPKSGNIEPPDPNRSWTEQGEFRLPQLNKAHIVLDPLNVHDIAPFPPEKEPVIISIDVEAYERAHNIITEVGVSTLDTLDLVQIPPGPGGRNWINQIRSRHFRIKGRQHLINKDFCIGNPDAFQFGRSEFVDISQAAAMVDSCFEWPFSVKYKHAGLEDPWSTEPANPTADGAVPKEHSLDSGGVKNGPTNKEEYEAANRAAVTSVMEGILPIPDRQNPEEPQLGPRERNIILVGHDIRGDLDYLKVLGSQIFTPSRATYPIAAMEMMGPGEGHAKTLASIVEALDTAPLYRVLKKETQNRNLGSILVDLGLRCYFLHNSGNDARYTLEALIAMTVKARLEDDEHPKVENVRAKQFPDMEWSTAQPTSHDVGQPEGPGECEKRPPPPLSKSDVQASESAVLTNNGTPGTRNKEDLDVFEAAILASADSNASPLRQRDGEIVAIAERLKLGPNVNDEEPDGPPQNGWDSWDGKW